MGTVVTYNGVVLSNVLTREWDQSVVYDDSGTDPLYSTFRLRFEGFLHGQIGGVVWAGSNRNHADTVANYEDARARILQPRCELSVSVANSLGAAREILHVAPATAATNRADRDVDNGPKPRSFKILQIVGAQCLKVAFDIECSKVECVAGYQIHTGGQSSGGGKVPPLVLNNRWSIEEELDEACFLTRTVSGRLRLSKAVASTGIDGKYLVVPGIERGFRRRSITFSTDKTGLTCDYRVVDRQIHTAAPWPARTMNVRHTQGIADGINCRSEITVRMEGDPTSGKKLLIQRAIQIVDAKLKILGKGRKAGEDYIPESFQITDEIGERNAIEVSCRIIEQIGDPKLNVLQGLKERMATDLKLDKLPGEPGSYDPSVSKPPSPYGYDVRGGERRPTVLALLACYLQTPCYDQHQIAQGSTEDADDEDSDENRKLYRPDVMEAHETDTSISYKPSQWSDSHRSYLYTYARMLTRYERDECRVQLPIARKLAPPPDPENPDAEEDTADTCEVFRLAPAQFRRVLEVDVERAGVWPEIPDAADTYQDGTLKGWLLEHWNEAHPPSLSADGVTSIFRLTAFYKYALNRPPTKKETLRVGAAPHTKFTADDNLLDPAIYQKRIGP